MKETTQKKLKKIPANMVLITHIRRKYAFNSTAWPNIIALESKPKSKGKCLDANNQVKNYYSEKEWDDFLINLKKQNNPIVTGNKKIPGDTYQVHSRTGEHIHPDRRKSFEIAKKTNLFINQVFGVMV